MHKSSRLPVFLILAALLSLTACDTLTPFLPDSGPSRSEVEDTSLAPEIKPAIVEVDDTVARRLQAAQKRTAFADIFPEKPAPADTAGPGDALDIHIWEAPPAVLFGAPLMDLQASTGMPAANFPEQMVAVDGTISLPFTGSLPVAGQTTKQIGALIAHQLKGKAHDPQILVRITRNASATVTIVGEVGQSQRMPLTPKGERLLDALAASGGTRQPVDKMTLQLSRQGRSASMPLESVIQDPKQNVMLCAGDVLTALHKSLSFTSLGATGKNEEVDFETKGITLAQALGRVGGLDDSRANPKGAFIFRFEDPAALPPDQTNLPQTPEGKIPVVYRVDLSNPATFFAAQHFPVQDKDVIYVANAPSVEFQKFMNIIYTAVFSAMNISTL